MKNVLQKALKCYKMNAIEKRLCIIIIFVLVKNINSEIDLYNNQIINFEFVDYYTWKELSGDVFRAPLRKAMLLSSIIGNGFQLFFMLTFTLCLGSFGFSNPEKRANILNLGIGMNMLILTRR